jgi:TRAP-type uncharacterized transport system fused permease subunit
MRAPDHVKKRAFDDDEREAGGDAPARTEPTPRGRTAIALVLSSWVLPLVFVRSVFVYAEEDPTTTLVHRALTVVSIGLLLTAAGLGVRAIDLARKDRRIRRRLAIATLVLAVFTPLVWFAEVLLALEVYVVRERLDRAALEQEDTAPSAAHE